MRAADEYLDLSHGLACWSAYDPASKVELCATAVTVDGRLFFVDPIPLRQMALAELTATAVPAGVVLTNENHLRASEEYGRRFGIPVRSGEEAAFDGVFTLIPLPGAAPGEIALFRPDPAGGTLVVGDALINLASHGFAVLPDKYCTNPKELRRSLARLLDLPFDKLFFAHGEPMLADARERLHQLLAA